MLFYKGCPKLVRGDKGTENAVIAYLQPFLRRKCSDVFSGEESFRYGRSTGNQVLNNTLHNSNINITVHITYHVFYNWTENRIMVVSASKVVYRLVDRSFQSMLNDD